MALLLTCHQENRVSRREHFPKGLLLLLACEGCQARKPGDLLSWPQFFPLHTGRKELWALRGHRRCQAPPKKESPGISRHGSS